eukprot:2864360-Amphidinium_carterae.1
MEAVRLRLLQHRESKYSGAFQKAAARLAGCSTRVSWLQATCTWSLCGTGPHPRSFNCHHLGGVEMWVATPVALSSLQLPSAGSESHLRACAWVLVQDDIDKTVTLLYRSFAPSGKY